MPLALDLVERAGLDAGNRLAVEADSSARGPGRDASSSGKTTGFEGFTVRRISLRNGYSVSSTIVTGTPLRTVEVTVVGA
jgi:hypothetical protein